MTTLFGFVKLGVFTSDYFFNVGLLANLIFLCHYSPTSQCHITRPLSHKSHCPDCPGDAPVPLTSFIPTQKSPAYSSASFLQLQGTLTKTIPQSLQLLLL